MPSISMPSILRLLLLPIFVLSAIAEESHDVLVYGGTSAGVVAAAPQT